MGDQPRKHHFVPQFYLAGFTEADSTSGNLYVFDQQRLKSWKSSPKETAHQRDFHAIDAGAGGDPMVIERTLADLEGRWSSVVRQVVQQQALPTDDSFGDLMVFIAFMVVRVKRIREVLSTFIDHASKAQITAALATEGGRKGFREFLEAQGKRLSDDEFDKLVAFGQSSEFDVDFEQTWHVQKIIEMAATLAPILSLRKWVLWVAEPDAPNLICSDSPVAPRWATPISGPYSPAFGTPNTIVSVPLNRRVALASMIENQLAAKRLDRAAVANVNSATGMYANQLYSPDSDFVWAMRDYTVGSASDLFASLRANE